MKAKDLTANMKYVADGNDGISLWAVKVESFVYEKDTYIRLFYRWVDHKYHQEYGDQVFDVTFIPEEEFAYHAVPYVIQEQTLV